MNRRLFGSRVFMHQNLTTVHELQARAPVRCTHLKHSVLCVPYMTAWELYSTDLGLTEASLKATWLPLRVKGESACPVDSRM